MRYIFYEQANALLYRYEGTTVSLSCGCSCSDIVTMQNHGCVIMYNRDHIAANLRLYWPKE